MQICKSKLEEYIVVGILCRSSWWITGRLPMDEVQLNLNNATVESARIFCAVSSVSSVSYYNHKFVN